MRDLPSLRTLRTACWLCLGKSLAGTVDEKVGREPGGEKEKEAEEEESGSSEMSECCESIFG